MVAIVANNKAVEPITKSSNFEQIEATTIHPMNFMDRLVDSKCMGIRTLKLTARSAQC